MSDGLWAAFPAEGFEEEFQSELAYLGLNPVAKAERLHLFAGEAVSLAWAAVTWTKAERLPAASIGAAAKLLKPRARLFRHVGGAEFRRGSLVLEQLRAAKEPRPHEFPQPFLAPEGLGAFSLLSKEELVFSRDFDRPDPAGALPFVEDKAAPSRAYLKLREAFTIRNEFPRPGERVVDLGACPGGWTYVAAKLGADVLAFDRSPLDPAVAAFPNVEFRSGDAFQQTPEALGPVDWLLSDVICYPDKLADFIERWVASGLAKRYVITIKFQGPAEPAVIDRFRAMGRVLHLAHNKHELTFLR